MSTCQVQGCVLNSEKSSSLQETDDLPGGSEGLFVVLSGNRWQEENELLLLVPSKHSFPYLQIS